MTTLFIADLHLDPLRPEIGERFHTFLAGEAREARALYILGDLFEVWVGDDTPLPEYRSSMHALRALSDAGVPVYFMHGNRDFLIGRRFAQECGITLLPDPTVINLYDEPTALLHGDTLCTDDREYQRYRYWIRQSWLQRLLLYLPASVRWRIGRSIRRRSQQRTRDKSMQIMDVNPQAVMQTFRDLGVQRMIHGHTHRPARHQVALGNSVRGERIVLGDWFEQGSVLRVDENHCELSSF